MKPKIRIFVTGGTFDKEYNELDGTLIFRQTHLNRMIEESRADADLHVRTLMMIDSLDMTESDRESIADQCEKADEDMIIITHGTDTMVQTAAVIARRNLNKTVVMTGGMIPYVFEGSDCMFNLGCAIGFVQALEHDVYICMNGRYFLWNFVQKNRQTGRFEPPVIH